MKNQSNQTLQMKSPNQAGHGGSPSPVTCAWFWLSIAVQNLVNVPFYSIWNSKLLQREPSKCTSITLRWKSDTGGPKPRCLLPSFAVESESSRFTPPMGTLELEARQKSQHLHLGFHISCGDGFLVSKNWGCNLQRQFRSARALCAFCTFLHISHPFSSFLILFALERLWPVALSNCWITDVLSIPSWLCELCFVRSTAASLIASGVPYRPNRTHHKSQAKQGTWPHWQPS